MTSGVQVWDASGNLIFDTPNRTGKVLGVVTTTTANGSVTDPNFAKGAAFWFAYNNATGHYPPVMSYNSGTNTLSWTWNAGNTDTARIIYGVY